MRNSIFIRLQNCFLFWGNASTRLLFLILKMVWAKRKSLHAKRKTAARRTIFMGRAESDLSHGFRNE